MGKGYAEGPAAEERYADLERRERGGGEREPAVARAVYAATRENPSKHFLGWADEIDADALFAAGEAWGISLVPRTRDGGTPRE